MQKKEGVIGTSWKGDEYGASKRLAFASRVIDVKDRTVCDIGCGAGGYTSLLARSYAKLVVGLDMNRERLSLAARLSKQHTSVSLIRAAAGSMPLKNGVVDSAFLIEVIEHVDSEDQTLDDVCRVLKRHGYLFASVPNKFYPFETHGIWLCNKAIDNPLAIGVPFLSWFPIQIRKRLVRARIYTQKTLVSLLSRHGFRIVCQDYMMPPLDQVALNMPIVQSVRKVLASFEQNSVLKMFGVHFMLVART